MIVIDVIKELKALVIMIFCVLSVFFVKKADMTILLAVISVFLFLTSLYIRANGLIISKNIFYILIASLNVFTMFFVIQYLIQGEISTKLLEKVFAVFMGQDKTLFYIKWIFFLTSGLIILEKLGGGKSGR